MLRIGMAAASVLLALASPAQACSPIPMEPPLPGESDIAYRARIEVVRRDREAAWLKQRQANALQRADAIFIGRDTNWSPPYRQHYRNGRPLPPKPVSIYDQAPSYFKPVAWLRGGPSAALFKVSRGYTTCGPMSIGDTTSSQTGSLYVFFARNGALSEDKLIDAIAVDSINDPALSGFVAKYRKPAGGAALSPR